MGEKWLIDAYWWLCSKVILLTDEMERIQWYMDLKSLCTGPQQNSIYVIFPFKIKLGENIILRNCYIYQAMRITSLPWDGREFRNAHWQSFAWLQMFYMKDFKEVFNFVLFFPWEWLHIPGWKSTCSKSNYLSELKMFPFVIRPLPQVL